MSNQKFYLTLKSDLTINGFKHRDIESFSNFDVKLKPEVRLSVVFHLDTDSKPDLRRNEYDTGLCYEFDEFSKRKYYMFVREHITPNRQATFL